MPFAMKVIAEDGAFEFRFVFYAAVQVVALTLFLLMAWEIQRNHLYRADTPPELFGAVHRGIGTMIAAFALSIPVAFFTRWAYECWIVVPLVVHLLSRFRRRTAGASAVIRRLRRRSVRGSGRPGRCGARTRRSCAASASAG